MPHYSGPLLTRPVAASLLAARDAGADAWRGSLDLGASTGEASLQADAWLWRQRPHSSGVLAIDSGYHPLVSYDAFLMLLAHLP